MLSLKGSAHKFLIFSITFIGIALMILLPQYRKHQTLVKARTAAERGKEIAFALDKYKNQYKHFAPDFSQIELSFDCERTQNNTQFFCDDYTYRLEKGYLLHIKHTSLPQWFEIDVENGSVVCNSEKDSSVGEYICNYAYIPTAL